MVLVRTVTVVAGVALAATACAGARPRQASTNPDAGCLALPGTSAPVESATVVLTAPIDIRNAPRPTTWAERFVFDLANESASRVDCHGRALGAVSYVVRESGRSSLTLEPASGASVPRLTVRSVNEADARDIVDRGVDLLLTDSPALATYAATRGDVVSLTLAWDRTWVAATSLQAGLGLDSSSTVRSELARDVVRTDARAAERPNWWSDFSSCPVNATVPDSKPPASPGTSRVVYSRDEPVARALAERLVALTGAGTTATGLPPNAFAAALKTGTELAYVFPLARKALDRCGAISELVAAAPWLARSSDARSAITPLIDTRLRAVVKRDRLNLTFTWDSTVTITTARP